MDATYFIGDSLKSLTVRAAATDEELSLANSLMDAEHEEPARVVQRQAATRVAFWRGELAGAVRVYSETLRLGEARLKLGCLAGLASLPLHQGKGIGRALIRDAVEYAKSDGCHMALHFATPEMVRPLGLTPTLADYHIVIHTGDALAEGAAAKARIPKPGDIPSIVHIHNANDMDAACSILRSSAHLTHKWKTCGDLSRVITNEKGKVTAYFFARKMPHGLDVEEVGAEDHATCAEVLGACGRLAYEAGLDTIRVTVPPTHPFARFMLGCRSRHETLLAESDAGTMAFADLGEALESMVPEWENRLVIEGRQELQTEATLVVENVPYRIRANHGAIDVTPVSGKNKISLSSGDMMHLITGYRHLDDVADMTRSIVAPAGRLLLTAIFPKRHPFIWPFDRR